MALFKVETIDGNSAWIESGYVQVVFELNELQKNGKWPAKTRLRMRDGQLIDVRDEVQQVVREHRLAEAQK